MARHALIISASRRTDIPAFYADWFMNRVREGFFLRVNPFNSRQISGFSLKTEHVNAICFWSKNPRPLMQYLDELDERGLNYYFQFTLNPYDRLFEPNLPSFDERIATFRELSRRIGPQRVHWRYDPVILSSATPAAWHLEQAGRIAGLLKGATCRLVFSFYDFYGKGAGRLDKALAGSAIGLEEITSPEQSGALELVARGFKDLAGVHGLQIFSCCEELDLTAFGIGQGACIDGDLILSLFGGDTVLKKDKNQREACNCAESVDMGAYNSCHFRCAYCYANFNEGAIESNCRRHDPDSPSLLGRYQGALEIRTSLDRKKKCNGFQPSLFDDQS